MIISTIPTLPSWARRRTCSDTAVTANTLKMDIFPIVPHEPARGPWTATTL